MISGLGQRQSLSQPKNIKIRNSNMINFADDFGAHQNPSFSFAQNSNSPKSNHLMSPNLNSSSPDNKFMTFSSQPWLQNKKAEQYSISFADLVKKLQTISYTVLESEYGSSFTQNSSYFEWITQMKRQDSVDKLLYSYTSILLTMIQVKQQQRLNSQPKFKLIKLDKTERIKLKLILNQEEENQINKFKSKGLQSYVKKIQDESERYKKQHIRIKERNRILQNQLVKLSLDFKNKRELYITEISRLTEILHSSFMEVGKMFINVSNPNNTAYPQAYLNKYNNKNNTAYPQAYLNKYDNNKNTVNLPQQRPITPQNRKNVKLLSPLKNYDDKEYIKEEPKLPDFVKPPIKTTSNYESYLKPQSVNFKKNNQQFSQDKRVNRHFEAESESAIEEKMKSQQKPPSLMLSVANYSRPKQSL